MAVVKVLVEGYVNSRDGKEFASSTTTLIRDNGNKIIVDPGMDLKRLISGLNEAGLTPEDITNVILTHLHPDHMMLSGLFPNAKIIIDGEMYSMDGTIEAFPNTSLGKDIEIIPTPGHDIDHTVVLAKTEDRGRVIVAGDLFWWYDHEEQHTDRQSLIYKEDPYMKNMEELIESRKKILEIADYIIPGHGKGFKV